MKIPFIGEAETDAKVTRKRLELGFRRALREQAAAERVLRSASLRRTYRKAAEKSETGTQDISNYHVITRPDGSRIAIITYTCNGQIFTKSIRLSDAPEGGKTE